MKSFVEFKDLSIMIMNLENELKDYFQKNEITRFDICSIIDIWPMLKLKKPIFSILFKQLFEITYNQMQGKIILPPSFFFELCFKMCCVSLMRQESDFENYLALFIKYVRSIKDDDLSAFKHLVNECYEILVKKKELILSLQELLEVICFQFIFLFGQIPHLALLMPRKFLEKFLHKTAPFHYGLNSSSISLLYYSVFFKNIKYPYFDDIKAKLSNEDYSTTIYCLPVLDQNDTLPRFFEHPDNISHKFFLYFLNFYKLDEIICKNVSEKFLQMKTYNFFQIIYNTRWNIISMSTFLEVLISYFLSSPCEKNLVYVCECLTRYIIINHIYSESFFVNKFFHSFRYIISQKLVGVSLICFALNNKHFLLFLTRILDLAYAKNSTISIYLDLIPYVPSNKNNLEFIFIFLKKFIKIPLSNENIQKILFQTNALPLPFFLLYYKELNNFEGYPEKCNQAFSFCTDDIDNLMSPFNSVDSNLKYSYPLNSNKIYLLFQIFLSRARFLNAWEDFDIFISYLKSKIKELSSDILLKIFDYLLCESFIIKDKRKIALSMYSFVKEILSFSNKKEILVLSIIRYSTLYSHYIFAEINEQFANNAYVCAAAKWLFAENNDIKNIYSKNKLNSVMVDFLTIIIKIVDQIKICFDDDFLSQIFSNEKLLIRKLNSESKGFCKETESKLSKQKNIVCYIRSNRLEFVKIYNQLEELYENKILNHEELRLLSLICAFFKFYFGFPSLVSKFNVDKKDYVDSKNNLYMFLVKNFEQRFKVQLNLSKYNFDCTIIHHKSKSLFLIPESLLSFSLTYRRFLSILYYQLQPGYELIFLECDFYGKFSNIKHQFRTKEILQTEHDINKINYNIEN